MAGTTPNPLGQTVLRLRSVASFISHFRYPPSTVFDSKQNPSLLRYRNVATMEAAFMDSGTTVDKVSLGPGAPSQRAVALPVMRAVIVAVIAFIWS
jgi:hypothetical protein